MEKIRVVIERMVPGEKTIVEETTLPAKKGKCNILIGALFELWIEKVENGLITFILKNELLGRNSKFMLADGEIQNFFEPFHDYSMNIEIKNEGKA